MPEPTDRPEVSDLENALCSLRPRADLDREAILYRAGRASVRGSWAWPLVACTSTALAAVLGVLLLARPAAPPGERVVERIVYVPTPPRQEPPPPTPEPSPPPPSEPSALDTYGGPNSLLDHVLRWGLDGLPPAPDYRPANPSDSPAGLLRTQ
jgi:hypothetical protein